MLTDDQIVLLREQALSMEREKIISREALKIIYDRKWFKLFVPEEYGGTMTDLPEAVRIFEHASWIEGSFGWAVTIGSGGGYFVSCFPKEVSRELFSDAEAVIAGSGMPSGTAIRTEGGYVLNGRWKFCSGSPYATVFTATATVSGDDGEPEVLAFALKPEQVRILYDWNAFGLKATGSHTISMKDAFVPERLAFEVTHTAYRSESLYKYPFVPFAHASFAAVSLGIGIHFLEEAARLLEEKRSVWNADRAASVSARIEQGKERTDAQRSRFYAAVERSWQLLCSGEDSGAAMAEVSLEGKRAASTVLGGAQSVFPYLGIGVVMEDSTINRLWRDLQTACQHTMLVDYSMPE